MCRMSGKMEGEGGGAKYREGVVRSYLLSDVQKPLKITNSLLILGAD